VLIVGGLVAVPVFRMLRPSQRFPLAALIVVAAWLAIFGWLDDAISTGLDPAGAWEWDESVVDFVRWIGWIPLVIALSRWLAPQRQAQPPPR
jgi:hypothetical protein